MHNSPSSVVGKVIWMITVTPSFLVPLMVSSLPSLSSSSLGIEGLNWLGQWALEVLALEV